MGKGDQKTRRGKIVRGTYGKTRPRKSAATQLVQAATKGSAKIAAKKK